MWETGSCPFELLQGVGMCVTDMTSDTQALTLQERRKAGQYTMMPVQ